MSERAECDALFHAGVLSVLQHSILWPASVWGRRCHCSAQRTSCRSLGLTCLSARGEAAAAAAAAAAAGLVVAAPAIDKPCDGPVCMVPILLNCDIG